MNEVLKKPFVAISLAILCQMTWGMAFAIVKLAYSYFSIGTVADSFVFASIRFIIAGAVLFAIITFRDKKFPVPGKKNTLPLLLTGTVQVGAVYMLQFAGQLYASSINCSIINGSQIVTSAIVAHFMFSSDRLNLRKGIGCILAFGGVVFCFLYGGTLSDFTFRGEFLVFASTLAFVLGFNLVKKLFKDTDAVIVSAYNLAIGGFELLIAGLVLGGRLGDGGLAGWSVLALLALISSMCFMLWNAAIRANPVGRIAIWQCMNPISGAVFASVLLGESVLQVKYVGAIILISIGIIIINMTPGSRSQAV